MTNETYANLTNEEILSQRLEMDRSKSFSSVNKLGSVQSVDYVSLNEGVTAFKTFESSGLEGNKFINKAERLEKRQPIFSSHIMEGKYKKDFDVPLKYELLSFTSKSSSGTFSYKYLQEFENEQQLQAIVDKDAEIADEDKLYSFEDRRKMITNTILITLACVAALAVGCWFICVYSSRLDEREQEELKKRKEEEKKIIQEYWEKHDFKNKIDNEKRREIVERIIKQSDLNEKLVKEQDEVDKAEQEKLQDDIRRECEIRASRKKERRE